MDFITGLPSSYGKTVIYVVIDRPSKFAHFGALETNFTAIKVAKLFVEMVVKLYGIPRSIVSDRDKVFTSQFWQQMFTFSGTTLRMSSAYHPQSDGQTEVLNRCLEQYLRCFVSDKPNQWSKMLGWAEYWYNTTFHSSLGTTPFQAPYGRPPPVIQNYISGSSTIVATDLELCERTELLQQLKNNLLQAQNRMKLQAD